MAEVVIILLLLSVFGEPTRPDVKCEPEPPAEGKQVTLTCKSSSNSLPPVHPLLMKYRWRRNSITIHIVEAENLTLTVSRSDRRDNYSCQASEKGLDSSWSSDFSLQPLYGPDSIQVYPDRVLEGDQVTCSADCNPRCNVTWTDQVGQVTFGQGHVSFSMDRGQAGTTCTARNEHRKMTQSVDINVLYGPDSIKVSPDSVQEGDHVTCSADCNPRCVITWSGRGRQVTSAQGQVRFRMSRGQAGTTCTARNEHGNMSENVDVTVLSTRALLTGGIAIGFPLSIVIIVVVVLIVVERIHKQRNMSGDNKIQACLLRVY